MLKQFIGVALVITISAANGFGESDCNASQASNRPDANSLANADRDYLVGWYKMGRHVIPVLKINGGYYSVCRGVEVPFKPCADGLEWSLTVSSMKGTTIGYDRINDYYFIIIKDSMMASVQEETSESIQKSGFELGKRTPAARIERPAGLLDANAPAPKTNEEFLGTYQPLWFPYVRFEIQKQGEKYYWQELNIGSADHNGWIKRGEPREIVALTGELGFGEFGRKSTKLVYNKSLWRFEMVMAGGNSNKEDHIILRQPLVRNPATTPDSNGVFLQTVIGIPSWH